MDVGLQLAWSLAPAAHEEAESEPVELPHRICERPCAIFVLADRSASSCSGRLELPMSKMHTPLKWTHY